MLSSMQDIGPIFPEFPLKFLTICISILGIGKWISEFFEKFGTIFGISFEIILFCEILMYLKNE